MSSNIWRFKLSFQYIWFSRMTNTSSEPRWHKESFECSEKKISVIPNKIKRIFLQQKQLWIELVRSFNLNWMIKQSKTIFSRITVCWICSVVQCKLNDKKQLILCQCNMQHLQCSTLYMYKPTVPQLHYHPQSFFQPIIVHYFWTLCQFSQ